MFDGAGLLISLENTERRKSKVQTTTSFKLFTGKHNALPRGKCERCWAKPSEYLSQPRFLRRT
jgi:hypothetical protein